MSAMHLRTLGQFGLFVDDTASSSRIIGPAKPLALLVYLAMTPRRRVSRERLVGLLWSDAEPDRARSTLRQTIWSLRQKLGEQALRAEGEDVVLDLEITVDADRFQARVDDGDDVADLDSPALQSLERTGRAAWPKPYLAGDGSARTVRQSGWVIGTALTLVVR